MPTYHRPAVHSATIGTPIGPFTVLATDEAVLASGWTTDVVDLLRLIHPTLRPLDEPRLHSDLGVFTAAVRRYLDGDFTAIDSVPVRQRSGEYISLAWQVLRKIPAGQPVTYTEYAALTGRPRAVRAAAQACARNAAALFVPCHRVLRQDGTLGGFRWGVEIKQWLLQHEADRTPQVSTPQTPPVAADLDRSPLLSW